MTDGAGRQNKLGLWTSTSLVVGNMIGAGVFLMPSALAAYGSISLLGWVFSAAGAFLLARIFSHLSRLMPVADGGPYAYSRKGLGDFAGFIVAWGYWVSIWATNAALAVSLVSALSTFFPLLATNPMADIITGLGAIWILTWVNTRGIVASGKLQLVTTILKILPLLLVALVGLFFMKGSNFHPFNISGMSDFEAISATAAYTFFAFLGLECATIPSGQVKDPGITVPRATMLGILITTLIYVFSTVSIIGMIPGKDLQHSLTPYTDAAVIIWGWGARYWVSAGIAVAAFGALNGWILIQGQMPYAIARDKLFPSVFARENKKAVPARGLIISSILVSVLMAMNYTRGLVEQFKFLILLTTLTTLIPYLFSTSAYAIIRFQNQSPKRFRDWISVALLAGFAFLFCLWAIAGSGRDIVYWGLLLILAGIPFYVIAILKKKP